MITSRNDSAPHWAREAQAIVIELGSHVNTGLSAMDAASRRLVHGANQLQAALPRSLVSIALGQFKSVVMALLMVAALLAFAFSETAEGAAILAVIVLNGGIGFVTEWRATRSMESLKDLGRLETKVIRDGLVQLTTTESLVPGDIVVLEGGDAVTADIRIILATGLQANESMLTGESEPIAKHSDVLAPDTIVTRRANMLFKGASISRGSVKGIVVETGLNTELGRIAMLALHAESEQTPLEKRLNMLGEKLAVVVIAIAVAIAVTGILQGRDTFIAIEIAVALAVAAIPEGLPIVVTIALARGMLRMSQRHALINKLSTVETLGATSIILTDKTGTLTENRMTVTALNIAGIEELVDAPALKSLEALRDHHAQHEDYPQLAQRMLMAATLCNNASVQITRGGDEIGVGDPTELALINAARRYGLDKGELETAYPRLAEKPFDSDAKMMATYHLDKSQRFIAVKGAPEVVLALSQTQQTIDGKMPLDADQQLRWLADAESLGRLGLRTLAIARKDTAAQDDDSITDLELLGLVGIEDPARDGVKEAIDECTRAGISIVMVTGDHAATARNIAVKVGITQPTASPETFIDNGELDRLLDEGEIQAINTARVISRATPEQKLALITHFQKQNFVVGMTGDGVNDAPALKKADIGIAMGIRGTTVAKEAAHMVLLDDEFGTIVAAVAQGRVIYENIRKFVVYLLSCNISEVLIIGIAIIAGAPLPLLPLQILFLNLVTDIFPALALGFGEGSQTIMADAPRPGNEPLLGRPQWMQIIVFGSIMAAAVLGAMSVAIIYFDFSVARAVSVSFCTLALAQLVHVFNMRRNRREFFVNEISKNIWVWLALALCLTLIFAALYVPFLAQALGLVELGLDGWLIVLPFSIFPLAISPFLTKNTLTAQ